MAIKPLCRAETAPAESGLAADPCRIHASEPFLILTQKSLPKSQPAQGGSQTAEIE